MVDLITVTVPQRQMRELSSVLEDFEKQLPRDLAIAINATRKTLAAKIAKEIREEVAMKSKDIKDSIKSGGRANAKKLYARVTLKHDARFSLKRFTPRHTRRGVTYRISKHGGRQTVPGAFMGPRPGAMAVKFKGHVFKRSGPNRYPIQKLHGVSPYGVFIANEMQAVTVRFGETELIKQIQKRIRFRRLKAQGVI